MLAYVLLIADGGLEMWGTREAANAADVPALAGRILPLRVLLASVSFLILLAVLPLFPAYPYLRTVLLIYGLSVFAAAVNLKWVFIGQQKMNGVARGLVLAQALFAVLVVIFVHTPGGLLWVPVFRLVGDTASAIYFAVWFRREYGYASLKLTLHSVGAVLRPALTIGGSLAMGLLNYNFDSVLLGFLRGPRTVGWYNAAYKLQLVGISVALSYFAGLFPVLSKTYVASREQFRHVVRGTARAMAWSSCTAGSRGNLSGRSYRSFSLRLSLRRFRHAIPNSSLVGSAGSAALGLYGFTARHRPSKARSALCHHFRNFECQLKYSAYPSVWDDRCSFGDGIRRPGLVRDVLLLLSARSSFG